MEQIILFGAGQLGREALSHLRSIGIEPVCFVESNPSKRILDGIAVLDPSTAQLTYPNAGWAATVLSLPASMEVPAKIREMGVRMIPTWKVLPKAREDAPYRVGARHGRWPSIQGFQAARKLMYDLESIDEINKQYDFYCHPDYFVKQSFRSLTEIYFPGFIKHHPREHFLDCGAADGDSALQFIAWAHDYAMITAVEPDKENFEKLVYRPLRSPKGLADMRAILGAVSDHNGTIMFKATGDYSSRIAIDGDGNTQVCMYMIDDMIEPFHPPLTFIKMDVEGFEPEALWGARRTIRKHSPVLAICCYHETEHFWQIPTLIHALNPTYRLFFRRYAPVPFELVCYAVPPERVR